MVWPRGMAIEKERKGREMGDISKEEIKFVLKEEIKFSKDWLKERCGDRF